MTAAELTGPVETALRETGRILNLHGAPLTVDLLEQWAEDVKRSREASCVYEAVKVVDVFAHPATNSLLLKRAWAWCVDKIGAPVRSDGLFPATVLHLPRASLAFHSFDSHPRDKVSLICVPDLLWCSGHYEVMTPKSHFIFENFT